MDEYLSQIEQEAVGAIDQAEAIGLACVSAFSTVGRQLATMLPEFGPIPFAGLVPTPTAVVRTSYNIALRGLGASRRMAEEFAEALIPMAEPVVPWTEDKIAKRAERKTPGQNRVAA